MSSRSFKYWPEVIGVAAAIMVLLLSSCVPEDKAYYYSYKVPRYQYCIDVEGKTYFVEDFSRNSIQFAGDSTLEFTDIDGVEYSFKNVSYCKRRIPSKPTRCRACGSDLTECGNPHPAKPTKCEACGGDLTGKENMHAR